MGFTQGDPELADTGFASNAGGTGWFTAKGSAAPLETFSLTFTIFDKSDTILDTLALIDNWRWDCMGCVPSEVDSCGIQPQ